MTEYLTLDRAAAEYPIPVATLRFWISQGRLSGLRPGKRVLIRRGDLVALIEGSPIGATPRVIA